MTFFQNFNFWISWYHIFILFVGRPKGSAKSNKFSCMGCRKIFFLKSKKANGLKLTEWFLVLHFAAKIRILTNFWLLFNNFDTMKCRNRSGSDFYLIRNFDSHLPETGVGVGILVDGDGVVLQMVRQEESRSRGCGSGFRMIGSDQIIFLGVRPNKKSDTYLNLT